MNTPICDFVRAYAARGTHRLHMPGHKGVALTGAEPWDITEICGADSLYEADGIIAASEANASRAFGCPTYYSVEGSSQCIRAMLHLAMQWGVQNGKPRRVLAGRNAHRAFLSAAALLNIDVTWWYPAETEGYLSCTVTPAALETRLSREAVAAVYLTSPDYLGHMADIRALAEVCHRHGALLLVDNAHGAYLKFLPLSQHPIDCGADLCCDSAHKTLPVLTGGAYLHVSPAMAIESAAVKAALALFGSTSPSYVILQSLDAVNPLLESFAAALTAFLPRVEAVKCHLVAHGYTLLGEEPMKLTLGTKSCGWCGTDVAMYLRSKQIECEFADPDHVVLMPSPQVGNEALTAVETALLELPKHTPLSDDPPVFRAGEQVLSVREAMLAPSCTVPLAAARGRVLAAPTAACPPAVPIVVCGERVDEHALFCLEYYGIKTCAVVAAEEL